MQPTTPVYPTTSPYVAASDRPIRRISWGAIFAGVLIILIVQLVLATLGAAVGLSMVEPLTRETPDGASFGIGGAIWFVITALLSVFAGGWVAGRLAGVPVRSESVIHGVLAWALATMVAIYLLTSAIGGALGGAFSAIKSTVGGVATVAGAAAPKAADMVSEKLKQSGVDLNAMSFDSLKQEAEKTLRQTQKRELQPEAVTQKAKETADDVKGTGTEAAKTPDGAEQDFGALWSRVFQQGKSVADAADREALVNVVAARTGQSKEQAEQTVQQWQTRYAELQRTIDEKKQQAEQAAREAADKTAAAASKAALLAFITLVLGAIGSALGGAAGRPPLTHPAVAREAIVN